MSDLSSFVNSLRRPRLLIRAAAFGLNDYNRERVLKRLTKASSLPSPNSAVRSLLPIEEGLETARAAGDASYNVSRHVEVLIALLAEARLMAQPQQSV
jgi:hypothetical protein